MQTHYRSGWDNTSRPIDEENWRDDIDVIAEITGSEKIASAWIKEFGNIASVCSQQKAILLIIARKADSPEAANIAYNKIVYANEYMNRSLIQEIKQSPTITNMKKLVRYFRMSMQNSAIITTRVLHMDDRNHLIFEELYARGCNQRIHLYANEILRRSMEVRSSMIILATNHPNNDENPTPIEKQQTIRLSNICSVFDIVLIDHIIITKSGGFSLKSNGYLDTHQHTLNLKTAYPANKRVRRAA